MYPCDAAIQVKVSTADMAVGCKLGPAKKMDTENDDDFDLSDSDSEPEKEDNDSLYEPSSSEEEEEEEDLPTDENDM